MKKVLFIIAIFMTMLGAKAQTSSYVTSCDNIKSITTDTLTGIVRVDIWTNGITIDTSVTEKRQKDLLLGWHFQSKDSVDHRAGISNMNGKNEGKILKIILSGETASVYVRINPEQLSLLNNKGGVPDDKTFGMKWINFWF